MARVEVLRRALDADWLTDFEQLCRRWFASVDQRCSDPRELEAFPALKMLWKQSGLPLNLFLDQTKPPPGVERFYEALTQSTVWDDLAEGQPLFLIKDYCSVRRQKPDEVQRSLGWHQDSAVVAWTSRSAVTAPGYVAWVPITPVDADTPTLQIMPDWSAKQLEQKENRETGYLESTIVPTGKITTVRDLARGDILLFDLNCPHRTHVEPGMTKDRLSVDLRLVHRRPGVYQGELIPLTKFSKLPNIRRNEACPCGSGKRYKHCHGIW
jgi:hypothetical protein